MNTPNDSLKPGSAGYRLAERVAALGNQAHFVGHPEFESVLAEALRMLGNNPSGAAPAARHTPGEWHVEAVGEAYIVYGNGLPVARVGESCDMSDEEARANADLVATAPALLARLEKAQLLLRNTATLIANTFPDLAYELHEEANASHVATLRAIGKAGR